MVPNLGLGNRGQAQRTAGVKLEVGAQQGAGAEWVWPRKCRQCLWEILLRRQRAREKEPNDTRRGGGSLRGSLVWFCLKWEELGDIYRT